MAHRGGVQIVITSAEGTTHLILTLRMLLAGRRTRKAGFKEGAVCNSKSLSSSSSAFIVV